MISAGFNEKKINRKISNQSFKCQNKSNNKDSYRKMVRLIKALFTKIGKSFVKKEKEIIINFIVATIDYKGTSFYCIYYHFKLYRDCKVFHVFCPVDKSLFLLFTYFLRQEFTIGTYTNSLSP